MMLENVQKSSEFNIIYTENYLPLIPCKINLALNVFWNSVETIVSLSQRVGIFHVFLS